MAIQRSSRFQRVKKPLKSDMNVVPYIDVMLVLLVIFMVTAPMITAGVKVDLPQANNNPIASEDRPAMVTLDADGKIILEFQAHQAEVLTLEQLKEILSAAQSEAKANNNSQLTVLINGDQSRRYGDVMGLMAALQDAGLTQVGLLTEPIK